MLSIRQRGAGWTVRGVVKGKGKKREYVPEQRTGCATEREARAYADELERKTLARLELDLPPPKPEAAPRLFSEAVQSYLTIEQPKLNDVWRTGKFLEHFRDKPLAEIDAAAWTKFCEEVLPGRAANTRARYQTTLRRIYEIGGAGVAFPENVSHGAERAERVRWLPYPQADQLIDAYAFVDPENGRRSAQAPHARQIALTLRFLGTRTSETLQIDRRLFDDARGPCGAIFIDKSKNGEARWVPLHPRVREAWEPLLSEKRATYLKNGKPFEPLFLTDKGRPYRDPRVTGNGGNPFARSHNSACVRAGVSDFTPHDWRHHWASWAVREGMDLRTLQTLGGWRDLNQVQRYAAVDFDHAAAKLMQLR